MAKVIVDYTEEGDVNILSDSEKDICTSTDSVTPHEAVPVIEEQDDIDLKPDDTLESDDEDQETENEGDE